MENRENSAAACSSLIKNGTSQSKTEPEPYLIIALAGNETSERSGRSATPTVSTGKLHGDKLNCSLRFTKSERGNYLAQGKDQGKIILP